MSYDPKESLELLKMLRCDVSQYGIQEWNAEYDKLRAWLTAQPKFMEQLIVKQLEIEDLKAALRAR